MPDSIRQQIFSAIKQRFAGVIIGQQGYQTNIGRNFFAWRDFEHSPVTKEEIDRINSDGRSEVEKVFGCHSIADPDCELRTEDSSLMHDAWTLTVQVSAACLGPTTVETGSPDENARKIVADIYSAINIDRKWGGLAENTFPVRDKIGVVHAENRWGVATVTLLVHYHTRHFAPFQQ